MYSGTTLTKRSGRIIGVHQKIDRLAHRNLLILDPEIKFPAIKTILHFEGLNGPDAIKRKSPSKDEPWHFISPYDLDDNQLIELISHHYHELVIGLKKFNYTKSAFEAAWLSHALVDGLTPAHHYPYEEKLEELRNGQAKETRNTLRDRLIMSGDKKINVLHNNWKMWGPKGLFITHAAFEVGVASIMAPLKFKQTLPSKTDLETFNKGLDQWYRQTAQNVAQIGFYDDFYKKGWTIELANKIRKTLAPTLIRCVSTAWYSAISEANK